MKWQCFFTSTIVTSHFHLPNHCHVTNGEKPKVLRKFSINPKSHESWCQDWLAPPRVGTLDETYGGWWGFGLAGVGGGVDFVLIGWSTVGLDYSGNHLCLKAFLSKLLKTVLVSPFVDLPAQTCISSRGCPNKPFVGLYPRGIWAHFVRFLMFSNWYEMAYKYIQYYVNRLQLFVVPASEKWSVPD